MVIESVDRHEAGIYICEASNGVGHKSATATIKLQVLCKYLQTVENLQYYHFLPSSFLLLDPPEIELETDRVHSGENKEAHLTCIIHGNPTPTVSISTLHTTLKGERKVNISSTRKNTLKTLP